MVGYLNQVNIEYVKKDTYTTYLCWLKATKLISIGASGILQAFRGDLYGHHHGHNIVHIQLQYIYILIYPHFMDQSFVFVRSLCNLDFHTLSQPVTKLSCTP